MSNKTDNSSLIVRTKAAALQCYFFNLRMSRQMDKNIPLQYTKSFPFKKTVHLAQVQQSFPAFPPAHFFSKSKNSFINSLFTNTRMHCSKIQQFAHQEEEINF